MVRKKLISKERKCHVLQDILQHFVEVQGVFK